MSGAIFFLTFLDQPQHPVFIIRRSQGKMKDLVLPLHRHPGLLSQMRVAYILSVMSPSAIPNETTKRFVGKKKVGPTKITTNRINGC